MAAVGLSILAAFGFASSAILSRQGMQAIFPLPGVMVSLFFSFLLASAMVLIFAFSDISGIPQVAVLWILALGVMNFLGGRSQNFLSVNLIGPFRCTHAAAPYLRAAKGAVVNTASISGYGGGGSSSPYSCTKAGLINLTRELARGLAPEVRVNAIAPGMVNSDWECRFDENHRESALKRMPLQRAGDPEDYAEVIFFLCAGATYVTGQTITVDGGLRS